MTTDFPTLDDIVLEVEEPATPGALRNHIVNPNGTLGGWGWICPEPGTFVGKDPVATAYDALRFSKDATAAPAWDTFSEPFAVTAGHYIRLYCALVERAAGSGLVPAFRFRYLDENLDFLSDSIVQGPGGAWDGTTDSHFRPAALQIPAGAKYAQLRISLGTTGATWQTYSFITVATAPTSAELTPLDYIDPEPSYAVVTGGTLSLGIVRDELNISTLSATLRDLAVDPATTDLIRPGRRIRAFVDTGTELEPLFVGKVDNANVTYDLTKPVDKRAVVTLTATDSAAVLAQTSRPYGVALIADLPHVLEGAGVPWIINGNTAHVGSAATVSANANAKALDQVAITRDSRNGYAWVDRAGVLNAYDDLSLPTTVAGVLDEDDYLNSGLDVSFDLDHCINEVTIKHLVPNAITGETTEHVWGPYRDQASVKEWGARSREFVVHGLTNDEATMLGLASKIFSANATPRIRINKVAVPIRSAADLTAAKALADLYALIKVTNTSAGLDQTDRVTRLEHQIAPGRWTTVLEFAEDGSVATPQTTPNLVAPTPATPGSGSGPLEPGDVIYTAATSRAGCLPCDGAAVSRTTYAALFAAIGTTYGAGNGTTTFNVPDGRSRVIIGAGTFKALGGNDGVAEASRTLRHQHGINSSAVTANVSSNTTTGGTADRVTSIAGGNHAHGGSTALSGTNDLPHIALNAFIKF